MARFVAFVEGFAVGCAAAAVDCDDVFDHGVDCGTQLGALGDRGHAAWGGDLVVAEEVDEEEFGAEDEEHRGEGHGEEADGRVLLDRAAGNS